MADPLRILDDCGWFNIDANMGDKVDALMMVGLIQ
jgi:hypothetical protein